MPRLSDGTVTPFTKASPETRESMMEAVREAKGRRAIHPAHTIDAALSDLESFLVVPSWAEGETAADVAAETLREVHGLDAADVPHAWALYTAGARRLGFGGPVPVPQLATETPLRA